MQSLLYQLKQEVVQGKFFNFQLTLFMGTSTKRASRLTCLNLRILKYTGARPFPFYSYFVLSRLPLHPL